MRPSRVSSMETLPNEELVASNLVLFSGDIYTKADAERFLEVYILDKPDPMRCIAWLIGLGIIPGDRNEWMPAIMKLVNDFKRISTRLLEDSFDNPFTILTDVQKQQYESITNEKFEEFRKMAQIHGLSETSVEDSRIRIQRLFTLIIRENPKYVYMQGTEYLLMISLLLTMSMTSIGTLGNYFAEAIAYHLTCSLFSISYFNKKLFSLGAKNDHTNDIIDQAQKRFPNVLSKLHSCGISVFATISEWEILMFASLHQPDVLFLLIDSIILHRLTFEKYISCLILSHLKQLSLSNSDFASEAYGMEGKWNVIALLRDAEEISNEKQFDFLNYIITYMLPCLSFLIPKKTGNNYFRKN